MGGLRLSLSLLVLSHLQSIGRRSAGMTPLDIKYRTVDTSNIVANHKLSTPFSMMSLPDHLNSA